MKMFFALVLIGVLSVIALPAVAQDNTTTYDFEDDLVQGDLVRPDGENLIVRRRGARAFA